MTRIPVRTKCYGYITLAILAASAMSTVWLVVRLLAERFLR